MKCEIEVTERNWRPPLLAGPICLVTTVNEDGFANVAPKSLVTYATVSPYRIAIGCSRSHHTAQNIVRSGECVLNLPDDRLAAKTWAAAEYMDPAADELEASHGCPLWRCGRRASRSAAPTSSAASSRRSGLGTSAS